MAFGTPPPPAGACWGLFVAGDTCCRGAGLYAVVVFTAAGFGGVPMPEWGYHSNGVHTYSL